MDKLVNYLDKITSHSFLWGYSFQMESPSYYLQVAYSICVWSRPTAKTMWGLGMNARIGLKEDMLDGRISYHDWNSGFTAFYLSIRWQLWYCAMYILISQTTHCEKIHSRKTVRMGFCKSLRAETISGFRSIWSIPEILTSLYDH